MNPKELHSIQDFTPFLFLHMGMVDGSLHPVERDAILEKIKELFPHEDYSEEKLELLERNYRELKPETIEDFLKDGFERFATIEEARRKHIYAALFDIINANGRVHEKETQMLKSVKAWLLASHQS